MFNQIDVGASAAKTALAALIRGANASLSVKSNVSPDIAINLADILDPTPGAQPITSQNEATLKLIKPEIEIQTMGLSSVYAPYGSPNPDAYIYFILILIISALLGARIAWAFCRSLKKS